MRANAAEHPDSNLLAAFAEQALSRKERAGIAEHLARCADCRESLFLACAAKPEALRTTRWRFIPPFRAGLLTWPLAASLCIAACLFLFTQRNAQVRQSDSPAKSETTVAAAIPDTQAKPTSAEIAERIQQAGRKHAVPDVALAQANRPVAPPRFTFIRPAPESRVHPGASAMLVSAPAADTRIWPRQCLWRIGIPAGEPTGTGGQVQRSFDGGKTWETISLSEKVRFRAVGSSGTHVWAGGPGGLLFYSTDGGGNWAQISVVDRNARLTSGIIGIEARSPERVKLTTSSGEQWFGFDGNWRRLEEGQAPRH